MDRIQKMVRKRGLRFWGAPAEHIELFDLFSEIQALGARFEKLRILFGLFKGAPKISETALKIQLLIVFHKCGIRVSGRVSEHHAQHPTTPPFH